MKDPCCVKDEEEHYQVLTSLNVCVAFSLRRLKKFVNTANLPFAAFSSATSLEVRGRVAMVALQRCLTFQTKLYKNIVIKIGFVRKSMSFAQRPC